MRRLLLLLLVFLAAANVALAEDWPVCIDMISPDAPGALSMSDTLLSWAPSADSPSCSGIDHYLIYRDNLILTSTKGTSYTDSEADRGTTHTYRVVAYDLAGNAGPGIADSFVVGGSPSAPDSGSSGGSGGGSGGSGASGYAILTTTTTSSPSEPTTTSAIPKEELKAEPETTTTTLWEGGGTLGAPSATGPPYQRLRDEEQGLLNRITGAVASGVSDPGKVGIVGAIMLAIILAGLYLYYVKRF